MLAELLIMLGFEGTKYGLNALSQDSKIDEWGVFWDGNGQQRLYPSLKLVSYAHAPNGEFVLKDKKGNIVKNIDYERSKKYEEEAIKKGHQYYWRTGTGKLGNKRIEGDRYCKVGNPNQYYVHRVISFHDRNTNDFYCGIFYMRTDYILTDVTEETKENDIKKYGEIKYDMHNKLIQMFNNKAKNDEDFQNIMAYRRAYDFVIYYQKKEDNYIQTQWDDEFLNTIPGFNTVNAGEESEEDYGEMPF